MDQPLILAIETATEYGSVSLTCGNSESGRIIAEISSHPGVTHSRRLLGSIDWLMNHADVSWSQLAGIAVSCGPGSFTGLRIGMAAAKGLAMATGVNFFAIPTLDALALSCCPYTEHLICSLIDARKQQVYAAFYKPGYKQPPIRISDYKAVNPLSLLQGIDEPVLLVGNGITVCPEVLKEEERVHIAAANFFIPRASAIGFLAGNRIEEDGEEHDPIHAAPFYVRASEAEVLFGKIKKVDF